MENNFYPQSMYNPFFNELVPPEGRCNTLEGELLRAVVRISQVYYYDELEFFMGVGATLAGPAATYLKNKCIDIPELEGVPDILLQMSTFAIDYGSGIQEIEGLVCNYIASRSGVYSDNSEDMLECISEWDHGFIVDIDDDEDD
jgi:hypothetical protein